MAIHARYVLSDDQQLRQSARNGCPRSRKVVAMRQNIRLRGVKNLRDLGGIPTQDGRVVRPHLLMRSGRLKKLPDKSVTVLRDELGVRVVIDLRTRQEVAESPDPALPGVEMLHLPAINDPTAGLTHERYRAQKHDLMSIIPDMNTLYPKMVSVAAVPNLQLILTTIMDAAEARRGVLFHCTMGKDRTGVVAALVLSMLNVSREEIVNDYLLTHGTDLIKAHIATWLVRIAKRNKPAAAKIKESFAAKAIYLESVFSYIDATYGGMDVYLEQVLGMTPARQEAFRAAVLE